MNTHSSRWLSQSVSNDSICDQFEESWQQYVQDDSNTRTSPCVEELLSRVDKSTRFQLFRDLLTVELLYRERCGSPLSEGECLERFPELQDTVREVFTRHIADHRPTKPQAVPEKIGRYSIVTLVNSGEFGAIYRAFDETLQRDVAIKIPHRDRMTDRDVKAYLTEARILASLRHPNIVTVFDATDAEGQLLVVSEFIEGMDVAQRISKGKLSHTESAKLIAVIAGALDCAHGHRIVHRDVKPANILLNGQQQPFLADFGLALTEEHYGRIGPQGGTVAYMSPEQCRGEGHLVDGRSDIFSLGAVFYELLTGVRPFRGDSWQEVVRRITDTDARPPRIVDETIPKLLERICLKALARRATDRYSIARDMQADLQKYLTRRKAARSDVQVINPKREPHTIVPRGLRAYSTEDADFFLRLVPGPLDQDGLPDSIRFWKTRIEDTKSNETFRIGLVYGPSGCGKSSLIKAGLLPQLASHVTTIYVDCSSTNTEFRLLQALRAAYPESPGDLTLTESLLFLRRRLENAPGKKCLIVLDQFEQWLHARKGYFATELTRALRQCDGTSVQCLLTVRDDFWLAVSRFLDELDVDLLEGKNTAFVDLFDLRHARNVLIECGRAYGCLPDNLLDMSPEQHQFLDHSISDLAQDRKVISVRLALFAEMIKGRPWTLATLKDVNGTEGVGVQFLDDTFTRSGNPKHRQHSKAARLVLEAMVPDAGTDIRGSMRSLEELREASGYSHKLRDFRDLIRILDQETRLLTPTEANFEGGQTQDGQTADGQAEDGQTPDETSEYYQLTHDYVVHSLRNWLTRERRKTMQGRATLRLAERSASWHEKPNRRQLPTLWEFFNIYFFSRKMSWTDAQRAMMKVATKRIAFFTFLGLVGIVTICTWLYQARSRAMIRDIVAFSPDMVQDKMSEWRFYSFWSYKHLYQALNEDNRHGKLNLAKLFSVYPDSSLPPKAVKHVNEELLRASPEDFESLRKWVEPFKVQLNDELWRSLELFRAGNSSNDGRTLRAAGSLATLDTSNHRWTEMDELVVIALLSAPRVQVDRWALMLSPIGHRLTNSLQMASHGKPFTNPQRKWTDSERILAARIFATYCKEPKELAEMFLECEPDQSIPVLNALQQQTGLSKAHADFVRQRLREELPALPTQTKNPVEITIEEENEKDDLAKRQANAGIALLVLGDRDDRDLVRNRLFESAKEDPRAGAFLINRAPRILPDPAIILNAFEAADEESIRFRQACILMLGMYSLTADERLEWEREFLRIYRKDLNSGIHGASEWLLRNWWTHDDGAPLANERIQTESIKLAKELRNRPNDPRPDWLITADGTTYSFVDFADGGYRLAVSTTEVTKKEFKRFLTTFDPYISSFDLNTNSPDDDCPVLGVNFFEAAAYCNWLSDSEGFDRCYEFSNRGQSRALGPNFLQEKVGQRYRNISKQSWEEFWTEIQVDIKEDGNGYRLPTELEWKHFCRAGANTKQHYGFSAELLGSYAVYSVNSSGSGLEETHPVGEKMPNAFGIFDVHGNVYEWCQPPYQRVNRDQESSVQTALGGCYGSTRRRLFIDEDLRKQAWNWDWKIGLRVVRKLADSDD